MPWIMLVAAEGKLAIGPPNLAKFPGSRVFAFAPLHTARSLIQLRAAHVSFTENDAL
jgi:hypothetical protein